MEEKLVTILNRDGRISEHCRDEEAARGAAEKLIGGRNPKS